ncbi:MAG: hypothetical protein M1837_007419 [Sclerophora amabilis]|nr:MAG: hypothetical protein M1837_007419 [Sclerophora amabilis]
MASKGSYCLLLLSLFTSLLSANPTPRQADNFKQYMGGNDAYCYGINSPEHLPYGELANKLSGQCEYQGGGPRLPKGDRLEVQVGNWKATFSGCKDAAILCSDLAGKAGKGARKNRKAGGEYANLVENCKTAAGAPTDVNGAKEFFGGRVEHKVWLEDGGAFNCGTFEIRPNV